MLTQYCFSFRVPDGTRHNDELRAVSGRCFSFRVPDGTRPRPEWGYRLYAALLDRLPAEFGASVHNGGTTPISQFVSVRRDGGCLWTVNLLGEDSENAVTPALDAAEAFALDNGRLLTVKERRKRVIPDADALLPTGRPE